MKPKVEMLQVNDDDDNNNNNNNKEAVVERSNKCFLYFKMKLLYRKFLARIYYHVLQSPGKLWV
jgi:hypothetical protein